MSQVKIQKKNVLTCGSCSGLSRDKLIGGCKTNCFGQGKVPTSKICPSYKTDVFLLTPVNDRATDYVDHLHQLANSISGFTLPELTVLAALLLGEKKTRQQGYKFWQKVYIRVRGTASDNYINNFAVGRILDADKEYIRVVSEEGKACIQVLNEKDTCSIYTLKQFNPMRAEMRAEKKYIDPATERNLKRSATTRIEPIDFAVDNNLIENEFGRKGKKIRNSQALDLVSIVQKMNSGKMLARKTTQTRDTNLDYINIYSDSVGSNTWRLRVYRWFANS